MALAFGLVGPCAWAMPQPVSAQTPRARPTRTETRPVIDGRLDEAAWGTAAALSHFTQVLPVEGAEPTERTEVRLLYDEDMLYLGVRCYDREPEKLIASQMTYDGSQFADDRINLIFDSFHDQRNAYFFQINPVGARSEALLENNEKFRREWNTIWYAKASIDERGWVGEFAIPFRSIGFDPSSTTWGMEIERIIRRRSENVRWANPSKNRVITDVAGIGVLEGLENIEGRGVDLKPSFSLTYARDRSTRDFDRLGRPGADVFFKPIPQVTAALTMNTDFSNASVDLRQSNLTRFSLFFPETRGFFVQDAGIFEFGGIETNGIPFFSRRIGLVEADDVTEIVDIDAGLKVTGRMGRVSFGALQVRTEPTAGLDGTNLSALRLQANVLEESQIGVILTNGDPKHEVNNTVVGADFRYRNSRLWGSQIVVGNLWFQHSETSKLEGHDNAFGAKISYPNDRIRFKASFQEFQEDFTPKLGFVNRIGIRRYDGEFRYRLRPPGYFRTIDFTTSGAVVTDRDEHLESAWLMLRPQLANDAGDALRLYYVLQEERPTAGFELVETWIPIGRYQYHRGGITVESSPARPIKAKVEFSFGKFYTGQLQHLLLRLELRPSPRLFAGIEWEQNDGRLRRAVDDVGVLRDGRFTTRIVRADVAVNFSPDVSWTSLVQYDNVSDSIGINSRVRWEIESGNELFFVINQGYDVDNSNVAPTRTSVTGKISWTYRF